MKSAILSSSTSKVIMMLRDRMISLCTQSPFPLPYMSFTFQRDFTKWLWDTKGPNMFLRLD